MALSTINLFIKTAQQKTTAADKACGALKIGVGRLIIVVLIILEWFLLLEKSLLQANNNQSLFKTLDLAAKFLSIVGRRKSKTNVLVKTVFQFTKINNFVHVRKIGVVS